MCSINKIKFIEVIFISNNTLSVCIISKNEEKNIERCLKSIKNIADEIIVVDTGSTDKTVNIAKELGAKVVNFKWTDNFSDARNKSIDNATKDWILFLDCDEELDISESIKIRELISKGEEKEGYYLRLINVSKGIIKNDSIVMRLFKNNSKYRFKGKIHERILKSIKDENGVDCIGQTQIQIYHYGYDSEIIDIKKKSERNLKILLSYNIEDKDGYYYYVLGNEYARVKDNEKALECYKLSFEITDEEEDKPVEHSYLAINIIKVLYSQKKYYEALEYISKFKKELVNFKDMYFLEFLIYFKIGYLKEASYALEKYASCIEVNYEYSCNNYDKQYDIESLRILLKE